MSKLPKARAQQGVEEQIGQNWQLVEAASKLNEASIEQQEQRLQRAIDETREALPMSLWR